MLASMQMVTYNQESKLKKQRRICVYGLSLPPVQFRQFTATDRNSKDNTLLLIFFELQEKARHLLLGDALLFDKSTRHCEMRPKE